MSPAVPVAFVASSAEVGGAEIYLESVLGSLGEDWVEVVVVPGEGELTSRLRAAGHRVEVLEFGRRLGLVVAAARLRRLLGRSRGRVVHANGSRAALVAALGSPRGAALVWARMDRTADGPLGALIARRCARIVAASHSTLDGLGSAARRRAEVVYPGIAAPPADRGAGRALVERLLGCAPDDEVIVLSGRLGPGKGQLELLAAAPAVLARRPRVRIAFLGGEQAAFPGFERRLRERARDLGIAQRVHFLGHRRPGIDSHADAVRFVGGCDLLAAPSVREAPYGWQEGFGLAVAEAMQAGTPVVAYDNGSLPEVLGECGELVREGDRAALGEAIVRLLGDGALRDRMAACGRRRAAGYRRADAVAALRRVYAEVAGRAAS